LSATTSIQKNNDTILAIIIKTKKKNNPIKLGKNIDKVQITAKIKYKNTDSFNQYSCSFVNFLL
jgi:hypothetical protein